MRTALLAAFKKTTAGKSRASLAFAGRSVLAWQINLAIELGCQRIIVLADQREAAILKAQHQVEAAGLQFYCLSGFERLPALIHADDDLLVLADGMIGDPASITRIFSSGKFFSASAPAGSLRKAIISIPQDAPQASAFPEDFERIDAEQCWAGALLMRAAPVQSLSDFPAESDAISVILRLALQAKTECVQLTLQQSSADQWLLAHDAEGLAACERALIARHRKAIISTAPGRAIAQWLAASVGVQALAWGAPAATLAGAAMLIAALVLAVFDVGLPAIILAMLGTFGFAMADEFSALKAGLLSISENSTLARLRDPGGDALLCLLLGLMLAPQGQIAAIAALGPLAIGAARLAGASANRLAAAFWQDRPLQLVVLAISQAFGLLAFVVATMALGAVAQGLFNARSQSFPQ